MKSDLSKVKVGDRIWTIQDGWVKVKNVNHSSYYPIFAGNSSFTLDGREVECNAHPSAFTFNPFEQQPFDGYWAMVSNAPITEKNKGYKRFVFMEKNGNYIAWYGAETDEQVAKAIDLTGWDYAQRIPDPEPIPEYTVEELTALIGHEFKIKK